MLVADVSDQSSLEAICSKATVIINCVGPVSVFICARHYKGKSLCFFETFHSFDRVIRDVVILYFSPSINFMESLWLKLA